MWTMQRSVFQAGYLGVLNLVDLSLLRDAVLQGEERVVVAMTKQETLKAYRLGNYACPVPPVSTAKWDEGNWCLWINQQGKWTLPAYRVFYDDGTHIDTEMSCHTSLEDARAYFVGVRFEITETTFHTAIRVEELPR